MTTKRLLVVATMALIGLGLTALPTLTGATETELQWFDHQQGKFPQTGDKKKVEPTGEFSITQGGIKFGPCKYEFTMGTIWNEPGGMGEGKLETVKEPIANCPTSRMNCTVSISTTQELPWTLTLTTAEKVIVGGMTIQLHLSNGCAGQPGIPTLTPSASGSVEGQFVPSTATHKATVVFNNSGTLVMNGAAATMDGNLAFGTELTALPEES